MELRFMNWNEVEEYLKDDDRVIVPIGSTEQHGPYGLFGTDHMTADMIARGVAEKLNIITVPVMPIGMSVHHMTFPGSLTFKPQTFMTILEEIIESLRSHGFRRVMLLNGHGGNRDSVKTALSSFMNDMPEMRVYFRCWWEPEEVDAYIKENFGDREGHHSSPSETSQMMYHYSEHVKPVSVEFREMKRSAYFADKDTFRNLYPDGVMGADVNMATKEHGEKLYMKCVSSISEEINRWEKA